MFEIIVLIAHYKTEFVSGACKSNLYGFMAVLYLLFQIPVVVVDKIFSLWTVSGHIHPFSASEDLSSALSSAYVFM